MLERYSVKNYKAWLAPVILLMILCLGCAVIVLGQGGTGRETPNVNANKKASSPKRKRPARKPTSTSRSTAPANNRDEEVVDKAKPDDPVASEPAVTERIYWETIRLSTDPKDFKSYLEKYPNGLFAGPARDNLTRLEAAAKPRLETDSAGRTILGSISGSSEAAKPAPKPGSIVTNRLGTTMVYVPAGKFMMGSNNGNADERPVHEVTIKKGFYMGEYEVTQAEYQQLMGNNPSKVKGVRLPVEQVSWEDAQSFIRKLNEKDDRFRFRLPSEAEWEYACRAGTTGDYAGDVKEMAWFSENSGSRTHAGGDKRPNAFGLYDIHGNVWEWCADYYHATYDGAPNDGSVWPVVGLMQYRVTRGGSSGDIALILRSAVRHPITPFDRVPGVGFRVVATARIQ